MNYPLSKLLLSRYYPTDTGISTEETEIEDKITDTGLIPLKPKPADMSASQITDNPEEAERLKTQYNPPEGDKKSDDKPKDESKGEDDSDKAKDTSDADEPKDNPDDSKDTDKDKPESKEDESKDKDSDKSKEDEKPKDTKDEKTEEDSSSDDGGDEPPPAP